MLQLRDDAVPVGKSPGNPPRRIGYGELYPHLPGNLQIMVVAFPLTAIASVLWFAFSPNQYSRKVLFFVAVVFPIYVVMFERHRRKLQQYRQVVGDISAITDGEYGCKVLHYRYRYEGRIYEDDHMTVDPQSLGVGAVWVLVDPRRPSRSVLWMGKQDAASGAG